MKRCIVCQSVYTDDSLKFCLQDGGTLVAPGPARDLEATLVDASNAPTEIWPDTEQVVARMTSGDAPPNVKSSALPLFAGILLLLALAAAGGTAYLLRDKWLSAPENNNAKQLPTPLATPAAVVKATPNQALVPKPTPTPKPRRAAGEVDFQVTASSTRARLREFSYEAENLRDGNWETAWVEGVAGTGVGESLRCDFGREIELAQITITPGFFKSPQIWEKNNRLKKATIQFSDGSIIAHEFADEMRYVTIDVAGSMPVKTKWVRLVIEEVYPGTTDPEDTAISDISFTLAH